MDAGAVDPAHDPHVVLYSQSLTPCERTGFRLWATRILIAVRTRKLTTKTEGVLVRKQPADINRSYTGGCPVESEGISTSVVLIQI